MPKTVRRFARIPVECIFVRMSYRNALLAAAASLTGAIFFYYGTGLHPVWWLMWLAPMPVLLAASSLSRASSFVVAFLAWGLGGLNLWPYLRGIIGIPIGIVILVVVGPALIFGLAVLLHRSLLLQGRCWLAAFALPSLWVSYEYLNAVACPHSTFGNLAYSQMNFLPVIQIASLTGIWGISFVIFLFAGTLAALLNRRVSAKQRRSLALGVGLILGATFLYCALRLSSRRSSDPTVAVLLIAKDVPDSAYPGKDAEALALFHEYVDELRRITPPGTQVIVLPEKIARVSEDALPQVDEMFSHAAADLHSGIVLGLVRSTASGSFNESRYYSPEGTLQASYDKHHLIPGLEPELPGSARTLVPQPGGAWGLEICKDMDFPALSREYGRDGATLLLVPAWDFRVDGWLHGRMAVLRSVENGVGIARSARNGILTINDNRGRILAEADSSSFTFASAIGTLPSIRESTLYRRLGDWFAWLNLAAFFGILLLSLRPSKQR